jgi:hypothetical protein
MEEWGGGGVKEGKHTVSTPTSDVFEDLRRYAMATNKEVYLTLTTDGVWSIRDNFSMYARGHKTERTARDIVIPTPHIALRTLCDAERRRFAEDQRQEDEARAARDVILRDLPA